MDGREKGKKQVLLRLSPSLWQELVAWSEDDFRSLNGQIEYLLTECVRRRKRACRPDDGRTQTGRRDSPD